MHQSNITMRQSTKQPPSSPKHPQIHLFGCVYSDNTHKQAFFSRQLPSQSAAITHDVERLQEQNHRLQTQLNEIRKIIGTILYPDDPQESQRQEKTMIELLQELLMMILSKAEQNATLRQQIEKFDMETLQKIESNISLFDSRKRQSEQSSQKNIYTPLEECQINSPEQSLQRVQSCEENGIKSKYWPKVLFSIGKEVKTIDQISSNKLVKKDSLHSYSKSSSQDSSFKDLMHLKKNRLSIDRSIYIQNDLPDNPRFSVQNSSRGIQSVENFTKKNIGIGMVGNELTPIKQERFSDKYSEINRSKIKYGVKVANGDRFTFESTNSDPSSYSNNIRIC